MLRATGERVIPDLQRGELVWAEHLVRYRLAAHFAPGRRVLDAGSGEGYGTAMLAAAGAASATGVDVDEQSIAHAGKRYGPMFKRADVSALPFEDRAFDLITCFETIEHLEDDAAALCEFRRALAHDGLLIISTPNRDEYLIENQFHQREYSPTEFDALLAEHFPERLWLYQQNWLLSAVLDAEMLSAADDSQAVALDLVKTVGVEPGRELYSVVICGPLGAAPALAGVITGVFEANRMGAELAKIPALVEKLDAWIERARTAEHLRDVYEKRGDEWQERAMIAVRQQDAWVERARDAERQIDDLNAAIREMEESSSWRLTRPLRAMKQLLRR
jgi:2-polyprenyl-3-methyl-5-hydroxy-6-metoxy-1,4-benzoquinol methylase